MADYVYKGRTNYFRIKDEANWDVFMRMIEADDFSFKDKDGIAWHGFGTDTSLAKCDDEGNDLPYEAMLQEIIAEDDACIITEIGNEKLRYLDGYVTVITKDQIATRSLREIGIGLAQEMLGNQEWSTVNEY